VVLRVMYQLLDTSSHIRADDEDDLDPLRAHYTSSHTMKFLSNDRSWAAGAREAGNTKPLKPRCAAIGIDDRLDVKYSRASRRQVRRQVLAVCGATAYTHVSATTP
jgi:hypothetical protein